MVELDLVLVKMVAFSTVVPAPGASSLCRLVNCDLRPRAPESVWHVHISAKLDVIVSLVLLLLALAVAVAVWVIYAAPSTRNSHDARIMREIKQQIEINMQLEHTIRSLLNPPKAKGFVSIEWNEKYKPKSAAQLAELAELRKQRRNVPVHAIMKLRDEDTVSECRLEPTDPCDRVREFANTLRIEDDEVLELCLNQDMQSLDQYFWRRSCPVVYDGTSEFPRIPDDVAEAMLLDGVECSEGGG